MSWRWMLILLGILEAEEAACGDGGVFEERGINDVVPVRSNTHNHSFRIGK